MSNSKLLNSAAVGRKADEDAQEILGAYIATSPVMALNRTKDAAPAKGTSAAGAVDPLKR